MIILPKKIFSCNRGFTLIEIIIGLLAFSIISLMLTTQLSSYVERSVEPMTNLTETMDIYSVMEKITLDYDVNMDLDLNALKTKIGAESTTNNNSAPPSYGSYYVINNDFYDCDASASSTFTQSGSDKLLVTIGNVNNHAINVSNFFSN